ncbi:hypothetical protein pb186bvf_014868 [Paramecium bursaria]
MILYQRIMKNLRNNEWVGFYELFSNTILQIVVHLQFHRDLRLKTHCRQKQDQGDLLTEFVLIDSILISPNKNDQLNFMEEFYENSSDQTNINNKSFKVQIKSINIETKSCQYQQLTSRILRLFCKKQGKMYSLSKNKSKIFYESKINQGEQFKIQKGMQILQHQFQNEVMFLLNPCFKVVRNLRAIDCINDLVGQKVLNMPSKRIFQVEQIDYQKNPQSTFEDEGGKQIQIIQYYRQRYKIDILKQDQPLIIAQSQQKNNQKVQYLVPELCMMTGINPNMNHNQLREITRQFSPSISQRVDLILTFIKQILHSQINNIFYDWRIYVKIEPIKIPFLQLKAGIINVDLIQIDADQDIDKFSSGFKAAIYRKFNYKLNVLLIVVGEYYKQEVISVYDYIEQYTKFDWFNDPLNLIVIQKEDQNELKRVIQTESNGQEMRDFIFFFLPGSKQNCKLYKTAKQISLSLGIPSQIILHSTLDKKCQISFYKMLIQVSAKIGHVPWMVEIIPQSFYQNTLALGIKYVRKNQEISYFSMISTLNYELTQFYSQVRLVDLTEILKVLQDSFLKSLRAHNKFCDQRKLKNIIIYHDGVSQAEEQRYFQEFKNDIYNILRQQQLEGIRVTFVFCIKNCIQKFYLQLNEQYVNLQHGSIISDQRICQKNQFYLQSKQLSSEQSSNPTCYKVYDFQSHDELQPNKHLYDLVGNNSYYSEIQQLTYQLCWFYYSFTGPIKIPAPLKYAQRLCNFYNKNNFVIPQMIDSLEQKYCLYYI